MEVIPRAGRFHYDGCGCGRHVQRGGLVDWIWDEPEGDKTATTAPATAAGGAGGGSAARSLDSGVSHSPESAPRLRIAYLIPHHNVTGGLRMILKQLAWLRGRGHSVLAVFRGPPGTPVLPPWSDVEVDREILLPETTSYSACFDHADVVLVGYFTQLVEFAGCETCPGPLLYWEQGHEHVFGDTLGSAQWDRWFHEAMHLPVALISVSDVISRILSRHFGRVAPVVPNAIDCEAWDPTAEASIAAKDYALSRSILLPPSVASGRPAHRLEDCVSVLLIGNPGLPMKNSTTALNVLNRVHAVVPNLMVTWVCQVLPSVSGVTFPIRAVVNPPQQALPALYGACGHSLLLFTSVYEGWGMPVLEAMAVGLPVVSSRCHGVDMFAVDGYNCLLADAFDVAGLATNVVRIVSDQSVASMLRHNGADTARKWTWDQSMTALEAALFRVQRLSGAAVHGS
mmetsp:Transcript_24321/g.84492  ORF Transcript_24321/g.84492 Transcript_24321/m.84492 type:complete len:455 (-) Transcript_24321:973-2337(-)|eukprot:CAMPEP_0203823930 /NCGR_PEP_ID=MMETSP0115-20131106/50433_1 /ASSEMBLY_ACC=CAM_ASM_000227 /TAXON_ID=33651 /ORGANISM="Bicosoecid sp, Strain ms1" /LENGTH=454 /DNA_ID=CAMNT_0050732965 /DNA_START=168 /DNA_END=1532 /DNA_ORIENTATION=+